MRFLYFDIETTGFDPELSHLTLVNIYDINSLQQCVYKEWTYGEAAMIKKIFEDYPLLMAEGLNDVLVGSNVLFDIAFFSKRVRLNHLRGNICPVVRKAKVDTQGLQIIANGMMLKGSGLNKFTSKKGTGADAIEYYKVKEYDKLVAYSVAEREAFVDWLQWLKAKLPEFIGGYRGIGK